MTLFLQIVLTAFELDDLNFLATTVFHDPGSYLATRQEWCTNLNVFTLAYHQHAVQFDSRASFSFELFYFDNVAGACTVLFATG